MNPIIIEKTIIISDTEFIKIKELIHKYSGIFIEDNKKEFIQNKLNSHLHKLRLDTFSKYYYYLLKDTTILQNMINKITTNQTYFFREENHYTFLEQGILKKLNSKRVFRCWSAAASSGQEAYSSAMVIANILDVLSHRWEIVLSDINSDILNKAKKAKYDLNESKKISENFFKKYCDLEEDKDSHHFFIKQNLKNNLQFRHINLMDELPYDLEQFDVIFLRNIIIYFDKVTRKKIVEKVIKKLKKGGFLFMGHSESLFRITSKVKLIQPSIYQKV